MAVQYANARLVTDGLVLALDAADRNSYVSGSSTWNDLSGYSNTMTNSGSVGPTYGSTGSIAYFDYSANIAGSSQLSYAYTTTDGTLNNIIATSSFAVEVWMSRNTGSIALGNRESLFGNTSAASGFRLGLYPDSLYYLIGGNTRLMILKSLGLKPMVWVIEEP
jgi:hypothetical protein